MDDALQPLTPVVMRRQCFVCWACRRVSAADPLGSAPVRSPASPRSRPIGLVQLGAEALSQLIGIEAAGHIGIGFQIGAEVTALDVPGGVGVALDDPVNSSGSCLCPPGPAAPAG